AVADPGDRPAGGSGPGAPLGAADPAQLAVLIGPFVPDLDPALLQPAHVGVAAHEPQQLDRQRTEVAPLGGDQGKALRQVEADLAAEQAAGPGGGAVALGIAAFQDCAQRILVRSRYVP